jgi:hypothetical protein
LVKRSERTPAADGRMTRHPKVTARGRLPTHGKGKGMLPDATLHRAA